MQVSRRHVALKAIFAILAGCSPSWPSKHFPDKLEVKRTLFAGGGGGIRESCEAMVVEITDEAASYFSTFPPSKVQGEVGSSAGWMSTPMAPGQKSRFYEGAFNGCNNDFDHPPGDLPGWLQRTGAFYKTINGGEGIAIIVPRAKLAGFYYFG